MSTKHSTFSLLATTLSALTVLGSTTAQADRLDRETATPTGHHTFSGLSVSGMKSLIQSGYRFTDIEIYTQNPIRFAGAAVKNSGTYKRTWWWYYGLSVAELKTKYVNNGARLIDVESYLVNGVRTYAALMVKNSGSQQKGWVFQRGISYANFQNTLQGSGMRLVDVEGYTRNNKKYVDYIGIKNSGSDQRSWWYYIDYDLAFIQGKLSSNKARPIDLERLDNGEFACLMLRDDVELDWMLVDTSMAAVKSAEQAHKARCIDLEFYLDGGTPRYLALLVDNMANFIPYGDGCSGRPGKATQVRNYGNAMVGAWTSYRCENLVGNKPGFMIIGVKKQALDLGIVGMPGCFLLTDDLVYLPGMSNSAGEMVKSLYIPASKKYAGITFLTQFFSESPGANALGMVASNALVTTVRR